MTDTLTLTSVLLAAVPNPAPAAPPGLEGPVSLFISWMKWIGIIAGLFGFGMCALMMILGRRNRSSMAVDGAAGLPWVLGGLSTLTLAAGIVGVLVS
ncbi:hypothetical protein FHN55_12350 [Streptomyces sp. NP160]|uniref:hypothetical protein n=1 Tax=Streptomyces sp. NP160 TaxID=2586637 RepID=UPI001117E999|nr:hypothetical protein [Streptomyces sp. NP160]TNM66888.1 hypothetical protein FHN55_12350 [Streptomyces sp. NP160]